MKKYFSFAAKVYAFSKTAQGKRDIALVVAAVSAAADFAKQIGLV